MRAERRRRLTVCARFARVAAGFVLAAAASDCADVGAPVRQSGPSPFVVSAPHTGVVAAGLRTAAAVAGMVYVSLPAGSIPNADRITIHTSAPAGTVTAPSVDGGMDPVAVPAAPGDSLQIDVALTDGAAPLSYVMAVPKSGRPVVIRTSPPPKKRDVPLNSIVTVVFSEPIAAPTLTTSAVQLADGAAQVPGQLAFSDPVNLTATLTPDAPLAPATDYTLTITEEIKNSDGVPLASPATIQFTTVDQPIGQIAFIGSPPGPPTSSGPIFLVNADGSGLTQLTSGPELYEDLAWSPDGTKLAANSARSAGIVLMNADGSVISRVTTESDWSPAWSPDGKKIAFSRALSKTATRIAVINDDGTDFAWLTPMLGLGQADIQPAWSPDGTRIAFVHRPNYEAMPGLIYVVSADGTNTVGPFTFGPPCHQMAPVWSPDGKKLLFWRSCDFGQPGFAVGNSDGSGPLTPLNTGVLSSWALFKADWSPDGKWIVFNGNTAPTNPVNSDIYVMHADGSGAVRIAAAGTRPAWRPRRP